MLTTRHLGRALTVVSALALAVATAPGPASAATPNGCSLAGNGSGTPSVLAGGSQVGGEMCTFTAAGPVSYAGLGFWTIGVTHVDGSTLSSVGGAGAPENGMIPAAAGDTVTAQVLAPGGSLLVGNVSAA